MVCGGPPWRYEYINTSINMVIKHNLISLDPAHRLTTLWVSALSSFRNLSLTLIIRLQLDVIKMCFTMLMIFFIPLFS